MIAKICVLRYIPFSPLSPPSGGGKGRLRLSFHIGNLVAAAIKFGFLLLFLLFLFLLLFLVSPF